jgi:hypothetical protein
MEKIKNIVLKILPYFSAIIVGLAIYCFALLQNEDVKSLLINISATFIGIPLIFLGYDTIKGITKKSLNKEIYDYIKMQIDHEIFGIINQMMKYVYPYERIDKTPIGINRFMSIQKNELKKEFSENIYMGFQILKEWEVESKNIKELLKNVLIVQTLDDSKKVILIKILKNINYFDYLGNLEMFFHIKEEGFENYTCVEGKKLNSSNTKYPDRLLLLKKIDNNKSKVIDFGDFKIGDKNKLLNQYNINTEYVDNLCDVFYEFISEINAWLIQSDSTLLIDPKYIRFRYIENEDNE